MKSEVITKGYNDDGQLIAASTLIMETFNPKPPERQVGFRALIEAEANVRNGECE